MKPSHSPLIVALDAPKRLVRGRLIKRDIQAALWGLARTLKKAADGGAADSLYGRPGKESARKAVGGEFGPPLVCQQTNK